MVDSSMDTSLGEAPMKPASEDFRLLAHAPGLPPAWAAELVAAVAGARRLAGLELTLVVVGQAGEALTESLTQAARLHGISDHIRLSQASGDAGEESEYLVADFYLDCATPPHDDALRLALSHRLVPLLWSSPDTLPEDCALILDTSDGRELATILAVLSEQPLLRRHILRRGAEALASGGSTGHSADFRVEGPFDTSYSLALVNRHAALALARLGCSSVLAPMEAFGPYQPDGDFLAREGEVDRLYRNREHFSTATTVLRNMYPLRLTDMKGINNGLCCYGWEESRFPDPVVTAINRQLHLVCTTSAFVSRTLMNNGVTTPLFSVGDGVDHILTVEPDPSPLPDLGDGLRFLHISSCFPRKGVDVLLAAYGSAFRGEDRVSLVIKTFPNPHHDIGAMVARWRAGLADPPRVVLINRDLGDGAIRALYQQCHVLVAPSRGEGFGLPLAEAMVHGMPVIATGHGGQMAFCDDTTAWLLDYHFARADTHLDLGDSVWAEPDGGQLAKFMAEFGAAWREGRWEALVAGRTQRARERVLSRFSWEAVARRTLAAVNSLDRQPVVTVQPRRGFVTTWNSKCGIATYSKLLLSPALGGDWILANDNAELIDQDHHRVLRCWTEGDPDYPQRLFDTISELGLEQVHFQFNFSFFSLTGFRQLLEHLHDLGVQTFVTFHSTAGGWTALTRLSALQPELSRITRIFVHGVPDLNRLKDYGAVDNVCLFPHGVMAERPSSARARRPRPGAMVGKQVIASYGFLLPHKGLPQLIEAFALLRQRRPDTHLLLVNALYPNPVSANHRVACENLIRRLGLEPHVTLVCDYLEDRDSLAWLSLADFLVFPYQHTLESSSAAVRWGLASDRPVLCTPLDIFDDVGDAVTFLPGCDAEQVCKGLEEALTLSGQQRSSLVARQRRWLEEHAWPRLSRRLRDILLAASRHGISHHDP